MDQHRSISITFPTNINIPNELNNQNRSSPNFLKKTNIVLNTSLLKEHNNNNNDISKYRPKTAGPKIMHKKQPQPHEDAILKYKLLKGNSNENSKPQTVKTYWQSPGPVVLNNFSLDLNVPNKPTLLERYWKYNKIKKSEILTNRCFDSDDGR